MSISSSRLDELFERLWNDYAAINPQAQKIHQLLEKRGEKVINDHVAFRTFNDPRVNISKLAQTFLDFGYIEKGEYKFEQKKLLAKHYEHHETHQPKVFISELLLEEFSEDLQFSVKQMIDKVTDDQVRAANFSHSGRPWSLNYKDYEALLQESEYAAWMSAFGFRANHFTVNVNELKSFSSLEELNQFIESEGFELNASGGKIKGSPDELLEQSSTLAAQVEVEFSDKKERIPSCYYEFAKRYPDHDGKLFQGFIAKSADKIFESTDRAQQKA